MTAANRSQRLLNSDDDDAVYLYNDTLLMDPFQWNHQGYIHISSSLEHPWLKTTTWQRNPSKCLRTYRAFPAQMAEEHFVFLWCEKNRADVIHRPPGWRRTTHFDNPMVWTCDQEVLNRKYAFIDLWSPQLVSGPFHIQTCVFGREWVERSPASH